MGDALAKNRSRDFWKEVKKVNRTKYHGCTTPVIDGVPRSGNSQIAGLWSTKVKELYNHCNPSTRNSLQEQLNSIITEDDLEALLTLILFYV